MELIMLVSPLVLSGRLADLKPQGNKKINTQLQGSMEELTVT